MNVQYDLRNFLLGTLYPIPIISTNYVYLLYFLKLSILYQLNYITIFKEILFFKLFLWYI